MRKEYFNNKERGFFKTQKREAAVKNPMSGSYHYILVVIYKIDNIENNDMI